MRTIQIIALCIAAVCAVVAGHFAMRNSTLKRQVSALSHVCKTAQQKSMDISGAVASARADAETLKNLSGPLAERHRELLHRQIAKCLTIAELCARDINATAADPTRLCCFCCGAHADDLDVIVAADSTVEQRGEAYARVMKGKFPAIAPKLLALISTHPIQTGLGPRTKEPWKEEGLIPGDRIGFTLNQIWHGFTHATPQLGAHFPLFLDLLDYAPAGDARVIAISELKWRLRSGIAHGDKTLPPMAEVLPRLDRLVRDQSYPSPLRRQLLEILFTYADPNEYLDLAIDLTREGTPIRQAEDFRFATPTDQASRFTPANRKKYVVHCYHLLQTIDDGHSGTGYFLAMHIGEFLGVKPIVPGESPFKPDQRLPEYQRDGGLTKSFFQDTVNNAKKWWDEHKAEYQ